MRGQYFHKKDYSENLVAHYKLDDNIGTICKDYSSRGMNATYVGTTRVEEDGEVFRRFNGARDCVTLPRMIDYGKKSVYLEFRLEQYGAINSFLFALGGAGTADKGFSANVNRLGEIVVHFGKGTSGDYNLVYKSNFKIELHKWYKCLITYDGYLESKLYIDNLVEHDNMASLPKVENYSYSSSYYIGRPQLSDYYFKGDLKNIQIYNDVIEFSDTRYLLKDSTSVKTLQDNQLVNLATNQPTKEDFETYGFMDLQTLMEPKTEKNKIMNYKSDLEGGKVYSINVNRVDIPTIEKIQIL